MSAYDRIARLDGHEDDRDSILASHRNRVFSEFLARNNNAEIVEPDENSLGDALNALASKGRLFFETADDGRIVVHHGPSAEASVELSKGILSWPDSVNRRIAKSVRTSSGALFSLQSEHDEQSVIEVFVTDWSGCTAACAVAVHRLHPCLRELGPLPRADAAFVGRHVRHPVTGDLMPVWVADWVRSDFGTGAVMVNPGHNRADLEFARSAGLPIRFALMPAGASEKPDNWPVPPVIKTGTAVRTGDFDGMTAAEVQATTIETLIDRGLAVLHTEVRLPSHPIAELRASDRGPWLFDPNSGALTAARDGESEAPDVATVSLVAHPVLAAAVAVARGGAKTVLMSATAQKSSAAGLAALLYDLVGRKDAAAGRVTQTVDCPVERELDDVFRLALLVGDEPERPLVVRKQLIEQIESFLSAAKTLRTRMAASGEPPPKSVIASLERADPVAAFRDLHKWQKTIVKSDKTVDERAYRQVLASLLPSPEV